MPGHGTRDQSRGAAAGDFAVLPTSNKPLTGKAAEWASRRPAMREQGELVEAQEVGLGDVILVGRYGIPATVTGRQPGGRRIVLHATGRSFGEVTLVRRQRARIRRVPAAAPPRARGRCRR